MTIPKDVASMLRSALAHLDDPVYLETHPIAERVQFIAQAPQPSRGKMLRRALRLAIEALDPGPGVEGDSTQNQCYQVLQRYAIAKQSMVSIAMDLNISQRQAYRELHKGVDAIAAVLLPELTGRDDDAASSVGMTLRSNLQREVERLGAAESRRLDLVALIHDIVASARHLADTRGVALDVAATDGPLHIVAQRVMLRQALLNLLSHAIRAHRGERIIISLDDADDNVRVSIRYDADASQLDNSQSPYAVAGQLLESLDIPWAETDAAEARTISLDIPLVRKQSVLLVDDNEGMAALFRRYLAHEPYRFLAVSDARAALEMVETLEPDVILLDVMMPEQDGWELLDLLRATGAGRQARVIVCSIIDDPELSAALGAEGFLHKPVDRASLLQALERATTTIHSRDEDG